jgi:hypothetical protein
MEKFLHYLKKNYFNKIHLASVVEKILPIQAVIPNYSGSNK